MYGAVFPALETNTVAVPPDFVSPYAVTISATLPSGITALSDTAVLLVVCGNRVLTSAAKELAPNTKEAIRVMCDFMVCILLGGLLGDFLGERLSSSAAK